jgi:dolichyl-phosphate beta-glucosyltransferase
MSDGFSWATSQVLGLGLKDTQAGFKMFSAQAAEMIFPKLQVMGWAFDVEVLYLAQQMGLSISELPIPWTAHPGSKIKPWDPVKMFFDLTRIKNCRYETA